MIHAAIFDFDGTLTPLTLDFTFLRARVEELARRYTGDNIIEAYADYYIIEMIYAIGDRLGRKGVEFQEEAFSELCRLELEAAQGKKLYPYARDTLGRLKENGVGIGIITRTCIDVIENVFPDIREYIDATVTRDDTRNVKPHPEHVRIALDRLGASPALTVLAGDHPTDIEAGRISGTLTAGVLTGRTVRGQFLEAGADYIFDDIRGVIGLMGKG